MVSSDDGPRIPEPSLGVMVFQAVHLPDALRAAADWLAFMVQIHGDCRVADLSARPEPGQWVVDIVHERFPMVDPRHPSGG